jgi:hypothetical protein
MKTLLIIVTVLMMTGCAMFQKSVPVKRNFPSVPTELMEACPDLKKTEPTEKLSEVLKVVVDNYGQYHECKIKVDTWVEWYNTQKNIFESVK